jgi:hypothetical protein
MSKLVPTASGTPTQVSTDVTLWELGNLFITSAFQARRAFGMLRLCRQICAERRVAAARCRRPLPSSLRRLPPAADSAP